MQSDLLYSRSFNMNHKISSLFFFLCILLLCCCQDEPKYGSPVSVKVYGVTGNTALDPELMLGLFADEPIGADNVPFTVAANGTLLTKEEVRWGFDQSSASRFFAYAPYDESYTGQESVTVNVPPDQSTAAKMLKGNLLTAISSGGPNEGGVTLRLQHAMSAMTVAFDNRSGQEITSVTVSGFMMSCSLNLVTGVLSATGGKRMITPLRSPYDDNTFCFIYPPQDVTPVFDVTLSSGKTMAFTFDNYCHEYQGKTIKMKIQIDESTPDVNILPLSGVNIGQWNTNGIPEFPISSPYINLSGLKYVEPDRNADNFFSAYLEKVTVTAVDRTSPDVLGVVLEDESKAIHVWTHPECRLETGNTIVGPVLGLMEKPSADEFHISYFYTEYATVGKTDSLPCTQGSFSAVADKIDDWEYRRMEFRDVVLKERFRNGLAVFMQDSTAVSVICPGVETELAEGVRGNLTGFPVRSGSDIMIMVYDAGQFGAFAKTPADNAFCRASAYGLYDVSAQDTAISIMQGQDDDIQYSIRVYANGRSLQLADTRNSVVHYFYVYDCPDTPVTGHYYKVAFNVSGETGLRGSTMYMECVKVEDGSAWLVDRTGTNGLILAL